MRSGTPCARASTTDAPAPRRSSGEATTSSRCGVGAAPASPSSTRASGRSPLRLRKRNPLSRSRRASSPPLTSAAPAATTSAYRSSGMS
ncbi:hypothetical protein [Serinicoccus sp. CNJ-927]|uniref:hypothetical protein n=1 Tax=Serinicoccus sp. CNJ-927 TaxID=1904970 RepID=UPI001651AD65|nr:hypothetical protein [Serinicoccus sp. CNJ-927]